MPIYIIHYDPYTIAHASAFRIAEERTKMVAPASGSRSDFMLIIFQKIGNHKLMGFLRPTTCTNGRVAILSKSTIAFNMKVLVDCDAGFMSASFKLVEFWSSSGTPIWR